ncbi:FadR/GntR family transcriptional regulator [uncultured Brachybacterium sp.]|uniref:FadR/GntR family transcriptional regulator n=1 Tax=uncultured Brachybacterium sp. TaxID=189680 RepID=UPI002617EF6E|nr:FCD domain-containing protein [uncultured Brachybacterium sp.]
MGDNTHDNEVRPQSARSGTPGAAWRPVARSSTHRLVIDAIEDQIMTGALAVGDPLPPERELASRLQVSRAGVREAIRVLEAYGVLRSEVGSGRGAGTFVSALPSAALEQFLRLHVALSNFRLQEVIETRILLERASASLAAERANAEVLAELERLLAVMDAPGVSREDFNDADTAFHVAIAQAGGNALFSDMTAAIRASLRAPIMEAFTKVAQWEDIAGMLREQHHAIFQAISRGHAEEAAELTAAHIRAASTMLPDLPAD